MRGSRSNRRTGGARAVWAALALSSTVVARQDVGTAELSPWEPAYRDFESVDALLVRWAAERPDETRLLVLSRRTDGRPVHALEIHGSGSTPLEERPTVLLLGGLDGVSLAGGEVVLGAARALLAEPDARPSDVVFIVLPWAAPEALEETRRSGWSDGRNLLPVDEDGDGALDEDGPDDVDGDGLALSMLVEDAEGPWVRAQDPRFLSRARPGDSPRYVLTREGRDDDGDGRFNEDAPGGVVLDRNFPRSGAGASRDGPEGSLPLSERMARALADLAVARETAVALVFQGDHGGVGVPAGLWRALVAAGDELAVDAPVFEAAAGRWLGAGGRPPSARPYGVAGSDRVGPTAPSRADGGGEFGGTAVDWLYGSLGVLALELAPWGAGEAPDGAAPELRLAEYARSRPDPRPPTPYEYDRGWARWNDGRRGGLGFRDWVPVDLGEGRTALVGGWQPHARLNPPADPVEPAEDLRARADDAADAARGLAVDLPRLELRVVESRRQGALVTLSVRVTNHGGLPTGLWPADRWRSRGEPCGVSLALELPPGAELLAGRAQACLGRLLGGQSAGPLEWILLLQPGDRVALRARAPWAAPVRIEVEP